MGVDLARELIIEKITSYEEIYNDVFEERRIGDLFKEADLEYLHTLESIIGDLKDILDLI